MDICMAGNEHALLRELEADARGLGFEYVACGMRIPVPASRPRIVLLNNYPVAWQQRYRDRAYLLRDPTVQHGRYSIRPLVWTDSLFERTRDLWEDARGHGIRYGWSQSTFDPRGIGCMVSVARSHEELGPTELVAKDALLRALANRTYLRLCEAFVPPRWQLCRELFTPRQLQVLSLTADGKSCLDIGEILCCSESNARYHVKGLLNMLSVPNKPAAVARAWLLGAFA